ncbi:hypothetical protein KW787_02580 [Candidatus Pacearchaeota archaeon]|nr:hypothetical protein [Candidatus Pacearchaeota archaeon]
MRKKGFEFSFGWIFAIIVGAAVISLAIYSTSRLISTEQRSQDTELAVQLQTILSPAETSGQESQVTPMTLPSESDIVFGCSQKGNFGSQQIQINGGNTIGFSNKYVFAPNSSKGKQFYILSQPLKMPFKIADIMIIWPKNTPYCFVQPPTSMESEIELFGFNISSSIQGCPKASVKVCFKEVCDVMVDIQAKTVKKGKKTVYYDDAFGSALMYGAIFSDPSIYECQVNRLMKRAVHLSSLYISKASYLSSEGCTSSLEGDFSFYSQKASDLIDSRDISSVSAAAQDLDRKNEIICKIF